MRDIGDVALFGDEVSKVEELQSVGGGGVEEGSERDEDPAFDADRSRGGRVSEMILRRPSPTGRVAPLDYPP
jgi:hypothetical protein